VTKNDLNEESFIVEGWLYKFILPYKERSYMALTKTKKSPALKNKTRFNELTNAEKELVDFTQLRKMKQ
jgi:hypothetical protein